MLQTQILLSRGRAVIKLQGELTIYHIHQAQAAIAEQMARHADLGIDLSEVEELDTAGVQLLVWFKEEAKASGRDLPYLDHSPAVLDVLDLLHLTGRLGDPILIDPPHA